MLPDGTWTRVRDEVGHAEPDVHQQFLADVARRRPRLYPGGNGRRR
jgi:hypothetical protein